VEARRHAVLAVIPLAMIAVGFFVAPVMVHLPPRVIPISPLEDGLTPFTAIYAGAAVLAAMIAITARRGATPGRAMTATALVAIITASVGAVIAVYLAVDGAYWGYALGFGAPVFVAAMVVGTALRRHDWDRVLRLVGAFALAALPFGCPRVPGMFNVFSGGLVFLAADAAVVALCGLGIWRSGRE
jgi:hypothetical protein